MREQIIITSAEQALSIINKYFEADATHAATNLAKIKSLRCFIMSLEMFDVAVTFKTRLFCFIHNCCMDHPKCSNPNCTNDVCHEVLSVGEGFRQYCSIACANSDPSKLERVKNTCQDKYGVDNVFQLESTKEKSKKTKLELYGDENWVNREKAKNTIEEDAAEDPDYYLKIHKKSQRTRKQKYGDENWNNREKASETRAKHAEEDEHFQDKINEKTKKTKLENHGDENYNNVEKTKTTKLKRYGSTSYVNIEKAKKTKLERHGDEYWSNHDKAVETYKSRTGYECSFSNPEAMKDAKKKYEMTCVETYGATSYFGSDAYKQFCLETFGVENIAQCKDLHKKSRYQFETLQFDSAEELAYYVFLKQLRVSFEYKPDPIPYQYDDKTWQYFPDFKIGSHYVEIKGDHFFRADGTMFCPYRREEWTDERYEWECGKYEAKHQCMLNNNVKIILSSQLAECVKKLLCENGKDFLDQCKHLSK